MTDQHAQDEAQHPDVPSSPSKIGVKYVDTTALKPNPHNPRYLFDKEPLDALKASIRRLGILVPLTVYREKAGIHYIILDGQRRWMCAQDLNITQIPVNEVEEPTLVQNIVTMFQIHKLREDWELMPTALKLEVLMEATGERREKALAVLTGLDPAVVSRCKKLLSYPRKYQDMMLRSQREDRIRADFFVELYPVLSDMAVKKMRWFKRDYVTRRMLEKYRLGKGIRAVTDFRRIKQCLAAARHADMEERMSDRLREFVQNDNLTIEHLEITKAQVHAQARQILQGVTRVRESLKEVDPKEFYGEEELWQALEELWIVLREKLEGADRRMA